MQTGRSLFVAIFSHTEELVQENQGSQPKRSADAPTNQLIEELSLAVAQQPALVAQLQTRYAGESSSAAQKDGEIALLKQQLAEAQAEVVSTSACAKAC